MEAEFKNTIDDIVATILEDYKDDKIINEDAVFTQPDADAVIDILQKLIKVVYPGFYHDKNYKFYNLSSRTTVLLEDVMYNLNKQIALALPQDPDNQCKCHDTLDCEASQICMEFFKKIPKIREYVDTDVQAFYDGDPAAYNYNEIILCYPGLQAIFIYRIAHILHKIGVPILPRAVSEYAHSQTGIDIHPGATIDEYFFIDHGTGIVIGETCIIGKHVKIYQGVTLGALSLSACQGLRNIKRHPTIKDNVTIYSGASIFGGETIIGNNTTIGSSVFITSSVEDNMLVTLEGQNKKRK